MKLAKRYAVGAPIMSPPVRGRGLKLSSVYSLLQSLLVAPRAGAWIETHWPQ